MFSSHEDRKNVFITDLSEEEYEPRFENDDVVGRASICSYGSNFFLRANVVDTDVITMRMSKFD